VAVGGETAGGVEVGEGAEVGDDSTVKNDTGKVHAVRTNAKSRISPKCVLIFTSPFMTGGTPNPFPASNEKRVVHTWTTRETRTNY
jgi:hypothetical protein